MTPLTDLEFSEEVRKLRWCLKTIISVWDSEDTQERNDMSDDMWKVIDDARNTVGHFDRTIEKLKAQLKRNRDGATH
jgi:hypothetical protein